MKPLEILALVIMAAGFAMVFSAKAIVKKYNLAEKQKCEHADEMSVEEVEAYKYTKAVFNTKVMGLIVTIPGIILLFLGR